MTKEQQALEERGLIRWQMWLGSGLIAFGALSIPSSRSAACWTGQPRRRPLPSPLA
jgi:hypothetical protein